jgi:SPP1 gp7 family putative phage head morphogenesis protein
MSLAVSAAADKYTESPAQRSKFARVRNAEVEYARKLKKIAHSVGHIVAGLSKEDPLHSAPVVREALHRYSGIVAQWARRAAASMLADVMRRDQDAWNQVAKRMSRSLSEEIRQAPTGEAMRELLEEQVELITSIPLVAAQRVHELAIRGMESGSRASEMVEEIMRSGDVAVSRAKTIARTETARTSSVLLETRAKHVGSEGYIWHTSEDRDVRPLHKKLNGRYFAWSDPPVAGSSGERAHAGCIYNCRCYAEPVIPEE